MIIYDEPGDLYHGRTNAITFHRMLDFEDGDEGRCPLYYFKRHVERSIPHKETEALRMGRLVHTFILEGDAAFDEQYYVAPKCDKRTTAGKLAWAEHTARAKAAGQEIIDGEDYDFADRLATAVEGNSAAMAILNRAVGAPEVTVRDMWDAVPGMVKQSRLDWLRPDGVTDLKTCDNLGDFPRDLERYGYYRQLAFNRAVLRGHHGADMSWNFRLIAVEKREPYRCGVYEIPADMLDMGDNENADTLDHIAECYRTNVWPGNPPGIIRVMPSAYLLKRHNLTASSF